MNLHIEDKYRNSNIDLKALEPLSTSIVWLNIANCDLTDERLDILSSFVNLEKLRLEHNPISNEGLSQVGSLSFLNALNLNETQVTIKGLEQTEGLTKLKNIYVWKTAIKDKEAQQFELTHEGVRVTL